MQRNDIMNLVHVPLDRGSLVPVISSTTEDLPAVFRISERWKYEDLNNGLPTLWSPMAAI